MAKYIDNTNLGYLISKIKAAFWPKADVTNVTLADVAVTGDYNDLDNKPNLAAKEDTSNKVTSLSASSTDTEYPSAKCVYDLVGDIETLLAAI